ncbi:MAG: patatin-like phospholipase family protein [Ekhidna sp.]
MKTALITSGGGAKGAFSVGALLALRDSGKASFDIISGTSTGALIAALAAVGKYDELRHEYLNVTNQDILQSQNLIQNLSQGKPYFYSTIPLEEKIRTYITDADYNQIKASNMTLCFTAISLQTGEITVFSTKPFTPVKNDYVVKEITSGEMLRKAVSASSNQAAFLPPVTIDGEQYVDGGNREVLPSRAPVDLGAELVYALSNNPLSLAPGKNNYTSVLDVLVRSISVFIHDVRTNDYEYLDRSNAQVVKIQPNVDLDKNNPTGLYFDSGLMGTWMSLGYQHAQAAIGSSSNPV